MFKMVSSDALVVDSVYLYEKENATAHHTCNYELVHLEPPTPVLRRGQCFNLAIRFNRAYVDATDIVRLLFSHGPNPNVMRGTRGVNTVNNKRDNYLADLETWRVRLISANGEDVSMEVQSPVKSPVGIWQLDIETTTLGSRKAPEVHHLNKDIYLLFNPWVKEDPVYMENERLLDEYVTNDTGKIWVGAFKSCRGREWIFGQFDACVLPACQLLLEKSGLKEASRGDPIKMTRAISRIVNSNDDKGVLTGDWSGDYTGGTAPAAWTGSVPILEQFLQSGDSVNFGQCWVFAGVVTTVCRALGIPSRVVSNLVSAHDANNTLSVDRYYAANNEMLDYDPNNDLLGMDSIWNYHVWNEAWMARIDLPEGYDGWQAIDATPQETSDGMYQCGPTSVKAIRQGAVGYNYDVSFMLASVNADVMRWKQDDTTDFGWTKIDSDKYHIGRMILTKIPFIFDPNGDRDKEDITESYKSTKDSDEERLTLYRAVRATETARKFYAVAAKEADVEFELVDLDRVMIGEPFAVTVNITNKSTQPRNIDAILSAGSVFYNGVKANLVKRATGKFALAPGGKEVLRLKVSIDDYLDKLVEYSMMKLYAIATVKETNQTWADEDDFQVLKPTIAVKIAEDELSVGKPAIMSLSFVNPLQRTLTECKFNYASSGLSNKILPFRDVAPGELVRVEHQLVPPKAGPLKIVATFTSKQLVDVTGSASFEVYDD